MPGKIKKEETTKRNLLNLQYQSNLRSLEKEHEIKKHLATGETVFDRIYNTQQQSIIDLISRISNEAIPDTWAYDVKVEEFTNFALLIYLPNNSPQIAPERVLNYLRPVLDHCGWVLSNIAIFDKTRKSYLFFDKLTLDYFKQNERLTAELIDQVKQQGHAFTKFNSVSIECQKVGSHLFVPLEIIGSDGVVTTNALFDSGATITTLSSEVISQTGFDNLYTAPTRRFSTANGIITCPIVRRVIRVSYFQKNIEIAVNQNDMMNLLGMNFFEGMNFLVDFQNSVIHVWEK